MRDGKPEVLQIMKYLLALLTAAFIIFLLLFMSGSSRTFEEVEGEMSRTMSYSGLIRRDGLEFKKNFGLNSADYSGVMYYSPESAMSAEEVLVIRVSSTDQIEEVLNAVERRIRRRTAEFEGYLPEQTALLENACQSVRGKYIFFAVSADADQYRAAFEACL